MRATRQNGARKPFGALFFWFLFFARAKKRDPGAGRSACPGSEGAEPPCLGLGSPKIGRLQFGVVLGEALAVEEVSYQVVHLVLGEENEIESALAFGFS